ncbi:HNH endonuclease [Methanobacterium subterraneum]|uniref:HNH endonuclease n=1 Tax=Methanobacterium subterraneum TaxID=59277 RepID=A0A7K4DNV9_9EURY|nr:HNH endonuclease [Methanobacterium subterraneum]NMO09495.1 HNH endonuclease [Methanobacterium subterraneum]
MVNCWFCGTEITTENESVEHIIPNAVHGRLKSKNLLCLNCNNQLSNLDSILDKSLKPITALIDEKKDRKGKSPRLVMKEPKTGKKFILGSAFRFESFNPDIIKTVHKDGKIEYNFQGDMKQYKKFKENLEKKYQGKEIIVTNCREEEIRPRLTEDNDWNISIGDLFLPLLKIAINYYLHCNNDISHVNEVIDLIKSGNFIEDKSWYYYPAYDVVRKEEKCEILNSLVIIGDQQNKILYCYISLYGSFNFVICLNNNYLGPNVKNIYTSKINGEEVQREVNIDLSRETLKKLLNECIIPTKNMSNSVTDLIGILRSQAIHTHLKITLQGFIRKNPNKSINEIWEIVELEFDEIPTSDWVNWLLCVPHEEHWEQNLKCDCGHDRFSFNLSGIKDGVIKEITLISECNACDNKSVSNYLVPI